MRSRAFTLLEIVGVVAVIGVAGAVASFAMSDQIRQAKAKADAKAVVLRLQSEHRAARERLQPLKIRSDGGRVVTFQRARGPHCATEDGPATTATFEHASLAIGGGVACFNGHGEPDNPTVSVAVGPTRAGMSAPPPSTATPGGMAVMAPLDDDAVYLLPIRLDRTGVHDDPAQTLSKADAAALEEKLATDPDAAVKDGSRTGAGTFAVGGT